MRVLLLGGTTDASAMAQALAEAGVDAVFSYAGRTLAPVAQPLPTRVGGFGGVSGLRAYLHTEAITHVIDATHPFAAGMSQNAFAVCATQRMPLIRLERPKWQAEQGDNWTMVRGISNIPDALPDAPSVVFLAIGKQQIGLFAAKPQHHYILRLVDASESDLPLPQTTVVIARGPFTTEGDTDLMRTHAVTHVVAKNAGGEAARAKLTAARALGLPVIMADRPTLPGTNVVESVAQVMRWLGHSADRGV
ncbi:precorrin-6A reductase [Sulfitobacter brevis]|uniref:Precorrin-6A reductase n=1 Tax=Sulfitobacter brevis TaxID=74348 RepID=A0A1I1VXJ8_9RHOB|nr:cobalt-precorrin-6A reductase [Sulfitobacter brevis]SFD87624.1 precorrin-6A reductase [Sulfitobacter brevis]